MKFIAMMTVCKLLSGTMLVCLDYSDELYNIQWKCSSASGWEHCFLYNYSAGSEFSHWCPFMYSPVCYLSTFQREWDCQTPMLCASLSLQVQKTRQIFNLDKSPDHACIASMRQCSISFDHARQNMDATLSLTPTGLSRGKFPITDRKDIEEKKRGESESDKK